MNDSPDPLGSAAEEAAKLFGALADLARDADAHVARGEECRYCPICRAVQVVRSASPEVREHLTTAVSSLAQAFAAALDTAVPDPEPPGVEHIDLSDDWPHDGSDDVPGDQA